MVDHLVSLSVVCLVDQKVALMDATMVVVWVVVKDVMSVDVSVVW